jgi:hypothetical protein
VVKAFLVLSFVFLFSSGKVFSQQYYAGASAGFDVAGLRAFAEPDNCNSLEIKFGRASKDTSWQFEAGYRQIFIPNWTYPYIDYLGVVPLTVRYNFPFIFFQAGYVSLFRKQQVMYMSGMYHYLKSSDALYYSPGMTAGFGLERIMSAQWKINLQVNSIYSFDSWTEYKGWRGAGFSDYSFRLGLDYYFRKKQ